MRYERRDEDCWYDSVAGRMLARLPDGVAPSDVDEGPWLARKKAIAVARLNGVAAWRIVGGITVTAAGAAYRYDTDAHDQVNMLGLLSDGLQQYDYPCADAQGQKADRHHTAAQLKMVKDAFVVFKGEVLKRCRAAKNAVGAATDAEEVQSALDDGVSSIDSVSDVIA